ncbi:MAG: ribosomal-processing cysteine protease Prp [Spirochaetota bacterium]|nr:MAG: ribosomal-processing cysteine protease Prp [Spirochaetota bacterium]
MIKILINREKKNITHIRVSGHGGGKRGEDIVCAGVAAITQTALSGLLHYGKDQVIWKNKDGLLEFTIVDLDDPQRKTIFNAVLTTMVLGLKGIEQEHPGKVKIVIKDN